MDTNELMKAFRDIADAQDNLNSYSESKEKLMAAGMLQPMTVDEMRAVVNLYNKLTAGAKIVAGYWPVYFMALMESLMVMAQAEAGMKHLFVDCELDKSLLERIATIEIPNETKEE